MTAKKDLSTNNRILSLIVDQLKPLHPYKIILFGSYAYGEPDADSDIDLLVVLNTDTTPANFKENMQNKLLVRNALGHLNTAVSIDLVVHTRPMYQKFNKLGSMFAREIRQKGRVLYEAHHP